MLSSASDASRPIILCVEDEADLRRDIAEELALSGYEVRQAADGLEALTELQTTRPDLILCDITMPGLDGYALMKSARLRHPELADVPFVFLTALSSRDDILSGKLAGADDYLVKPVDFDLMLASIEARLSQVRRVRQKVRDELDTARRAVGGLQGGGENWTAAAAGALDLIAVGVVLTDRSRQVVFANRAARRLAGEDDGVAIGTTLQPASPDAAGRLRAALRRVTELAGCGTEEQIGLSLPRPSGRRDLLAIVCALPQEAATGDDGPTSIVFLSDPDRRPTFSDAFIGPLFGLTSAESQLALALAEGKRREDIAREFGISQTTVAFHMRNLFQKTGTHRQADLVALLLVGLAAVSPETG